MKKTSPVLTRPKESYIGDAVYVEYDDGQITLWLYYGEGRENEIIIGEREWENLVLFVKTQQEKNKNGSAN